MSTPPPGWKFVPSHDVNGSAVPDCWVNDDPDVPVCYMCRPPGWYRAYNCDIKEWYWLQVPPLPADEPLEWLQPAGHPIDTGHRNHGSRSMDDWML